MAIVRQYLRDYLSLSLTSFTRELFEKQRGQIGLIITEMIDNLAGDAGLTNTAHTDQDNSFTASQSMLAEAASISVENTGVEEQIGSIKVLSGAVVADLQAYPEGYTADLDLAGKTQLSLTSATGNILNLVNTDSGGDILSIEGETGPVITLKSDLSIQFNQYGEGTLKVDGSGNVTSVAAGDGGDVLDGDLSPNVPLLDNTINVFTGNLAAVFPEYVNNAAAVADGKGIGFVYQNSGNLKVVTA